MEAGKIFQNLGKFVISKLGDAGKLEWVEKAENTVVEPPPQLETGK